MDSATKPPDLEVRRQLCALCRRKRTRTTEWTSTQPTQWQPGTVTNPIDDQPFTDSGAWELVADLLDANHPIERVELDQPPGKIGYVLVVPIGGRQLYVKLQLGSGKVIGRSFHYSDMRTTELRPTRKINHEP
jgi:hypothetical protein